MMTEVKASLGRIQKELLKMATEKVEIKKTATLYYDLKKEVNDEIAKRKKELSTKLGTGNKSLPDMEKLSAAMQKYQDEMPFAKVEIFVPEEYAQHLKEANDDLNHEIAQSKSEALSAFQKQMQEQALNSRVLLGKVAEATKWYNTVMAQCTAGQKALKEKKNKELMTAKALIPGPWKQLQEMNAMYQDAVKDQWISSKIKDSKDKDKILGGVKSVLDMKTKAGVEVAKIANARL
jgi:chromosome segregation ATPase